LNFQDEDDGGIADRPNEGVEYGMTLHVIHISGKRMITQGTDG